MIHTEARCGECGATISGYAVDGLCPKCLLRGALGFSGSSGKGESKSNGGAEQTWGNYELLEEIARGGMGKVYKARQINLNRIVAVKVLLHGEFTADAFVKRFWAEAKAAASLQHPSIVAIHEIGTHKGQPFFSMDFIAGRNLSEIIKQESLPPKKAARYLKKISEAIQHAHERGVLHRDLKPSNILIDSADEPHITDFGLARNLNERSSSHEDHLIGSPNYMPPEQATASGNKASAANDIYSLGAILYHMLTGRPPALAATLQETLFEVLHHEPIAPRLLNPSVPRDLETICLKCLQKEPHRRYASATELASDLDCFLANRPIRARPVRAPIKVLRWCQRKPLAAAFLLTLVLAAAGATAASFHFDRLRKANRDNLYRADMNQAQRGWEEGNYAMALSFLRKGLPSEIGAELRGFEWQHLWWLTRGNCAFKLPKQKQVVGGLYFSPDGLLLATFSWDKTNRLKVWNIGTRKMEYEIPDAASFGGFSGDGKSLVVGTMDRSVALHDARTGKRVRNYNDAGEIMAFGPERKFVATLTRDSVLKVWPVDDEKVQFELPNVRRRFFDYGQASPFALSSDGSLLAVVEHGDMAEAMDRGVTVWNTATQKEAVYFPDLSEVRTLQFSPDGKILAVGDGNGKTRLWNIATKDQLEIQGHSLPVLSLAFSRDGSVIAIGSSDETVKLWRVPTGEPVEKPIKGHIGAAWALAFSPNGEWLVSGTRDGPIRFWDLKSAPQPEFITNILSDRYGNFAFSADGKFMAGGCRDHFVRVWEVATLKEVASLAGHSYVVAFTSNGEEVLAAKEGGAAQWWNFKSGLARKVPNYGSLGTVTSAIVSPDGRLAAVGHDSGILQVLEIDSGKIVGKYTGHSDTILSLAFSPDAKRLASGSRDKSLRVWDVLTTSNVETCVEHKGAVSGLAIAPNGKWMASGCSANSIKFWNMGNLAKSVGDAITWHQSAIRSLAIHPNGQTLASGSEDRTIKLWDYNSRRQLGSFQFTSPIRFTTFSPDGNALAVITDSGELHLLRTVPLKDADEEAALYY